jgi:hypothetical protein
VVGVPRPPTVLVARQHDGAFAVRVRGPKSETTHTVSVPSGFAEKLGLGAVPSEELVRASFMFLLDREPASSVLPRFALDVISRFFPEYQAELAGYITPSTTGPQGDRAQG